MSLTFVTNLSTFLIMDNYFDIFRPDQPAIPVLVDVPHAGEWIPDAMQDEMVVDGQTLKRDLDLYVDDFWINATDHGATMIRSNVSRYVVDLNRAADDISELTVVGGKRINKPGYYQDRGVVWRTTTDRVDVMAGPMSKAAFDNRIATFHTPYHQAIRDEIDRIRDIFGFCILLDAHSMPSLGRAGHTDSGSYRADIVPGDVKGTSCSLLLSNLLKHHFKSCEFSVQANHPYQGGWITRHFGDPENNVHAIQIEVNRALYMNEKTFVKKNAGIARLLDANMALIPKLKTLIPDLTP